MPIQRRIDRPGPGTHEGAAREWLVANGLGGFASGTVAGLLTRRYHGLLVAALPAPVGRMVMLSHVDARLQLGPDRCFDVDVGIPGLSRPATSDVPRMTLTEFRLEWGLPVWRYDAPGVTLEKRVVMPHGQNTTHVTFQLLAGRGQETARLELRPFLRIRHYESPLSEAEVEPYAFTAAADGRFEVQPSAGLPSLRLQPYGPRAALVHEIAQSANAYGEEASRGYPHTGTVWSPGYFHFELAAGDAGRDAATLVVSTESWEVVEALQPEAALSSDLARRQALVDQAPEVARRGVPAELVLAADQFLITPTARPEDTARASALGLEARTVIAGYHWFTDWGRDTMISLEGLTLATGRSLEAKHILRTFATYTRDGLIPNMFPDGEREGLYHTADATLWFFHAVSRYVEATGDTDTLFALLPVLQEIVDWHLRGTRFGIGVDPSDGLLRQGEEGYQLTWMDAKVDGWVVTPRRGKAVEINGLFYNALKLLEGWSRDVGDDAGARALATHAGRMRESFNRRFWYEEGQHLFDVVDGERGDDAACRPNQLLAISLAHPILEPRRWPAVLETVRARLLTPYGLRTLAPGHADYRSKYYGDLRTRDAAYHQGTVWPWLLGPYVDAWLRVYPTDPDSVRTLLDTFGHHLSEAGVGSVSEIFDAEPPFTPRGCIAQAWSVAEVLRVSLRLLGWP